MLALNTKKECSKFMRLDSYKEITPVFFNDSSVKILQIEIPPFEDCFPLHWHERIEIVYVVEGSLKISIDGDEWEDYAKGDIAIVCPRLLHQGETHSTGVKYYCISFEPDLLINGAPSTERYIRPIVNSKIVFSPKATNKQMGEILKNIVEISKNKTPASSIHIISLLYQLIYLFYNNQTVLKKTDKATDSKFDNVIKYINENFCEIVNTSLISEKFGYDESYFCRKFKSATGLTVMKYIKVLRLEHAQYLLKNTNEDIQSISSACGFNDHCYFTRSFKEYFGFTPSEYRTRCLKSKNSN